MKTLSQVEKFEKRGVPFSRLIRFGNLRHEIGTPKSDGFGSVPSELL